MSQIPAKTRNRIEAQGFLGFDDRTLAQIASLSPSPPVRLLDDDNDAGCIGMGFSVGKSRSRLVRWLASRCDRNGQRHYGFLHPFIRLRTDLSA